uniref:Uncharacterized protein n=1 Tax=Pristionchus pacificus TaxID=54126 RepID=A0A2A6C6B8_PRIPA
KLTSRLEEGLARCVAVLADDLQRSKISKDQRSKIKYQRLTRHSYSPLSSCDTLLIVHTEYMCSDEDEGEAAWLERTDCTIFKSSTLFTGRVEKPYLKSMAPWPKTRSVCLSVD